MEKLSNIEAEFKKSDAYKKKARFEPIRLKKAFKVRCLIRLDSDFTKKFVFQYYVIIMVFY